MPRHARGTRRRVDLVTFQIVRSADCKCFTGSNLTRAGFQVSWAKFYYWNVGLPVLFYTIGLVGFIVVVNVVCWMVKSKPTAQTAQSIHGSRMLMGASI